MARLRDTAYHCDIKLEILYPYLWGDKSNDNAHRRPFGTSNPEHLFVCVNMGPCGQRIRAYNGSLTLISFDINKILNGVKER